MIEWEAYERRLYHKGETRRARTLNRLADKLRSEVDIHPGCVEVLVDDVPQYIFTKRTEAATKKNFNTLPGEAINLGSVVFWQNRHWLVTESLCDDNLTYHGSIEQCNRQLKWQNKYTREIVYRWCTIAKPYYSNLDVNLQATISSREFKVQMPSDSESNLLDLDDRFMLEVINGEPKTYRITSVDMNTRRYDVNGESMGFLIFNIEQDQYITETDSIEHGICNYLEPFDFITTTPMGWCILEADNDELIPGGMPIVLNARYFDTQGLPVMGIQTVWTIEADPELEDAITQQILEDGSLKLIMDNCAELIGEQFEVTAMSADGAYAKSLVVKVVSGL